VIDVFYANGDPVQRSANASGARFREALFTYAYRAIDIHGSHA
jgi:hypothetical protein